ncbi:response regulator transcription factor [Helicobacter sp. MIT 11-5569]|uniref:response regulator transcription factor n=1 Tax=Helicobacter sp. MIT 11-5569 TaxID=1548151 RepID=UPI00051FB0FE|nr:response regulator [Helicobacter sp. MIT 11-5569]TLD85158.1 response regulator transcription factor [Helicobacter sp. MIT 11-5569]
MTPELLEPLKELTLLIVEDDSVALDLLKIPLECRCKKVITAKKGETALKHFKNEAIDIVITDVKLDGKLDGIAMVKSMRKINPSIPVIFMTAYSDEEKIAEMMRLNAASLIKKVVDLEELFVLLLNINKSLNKEQIVDLGKGISYRRRDKSILKGFAVFELTDRECKILDLLLENNGYPVTYEEFHQKVWGGQQMTMDSLRMHINGIRRKTYYELIINQSRLGYKIQPIFE